MEWLLENKEWVFSGIGVIIITSVFAIIRHFVRWKKRKNKRYSQQFDGKKSETSVERMTVTISIVYERYDIKC